METFDAMKKSFTAEAAAKLPFAVGEAVLWQASEIQQDHASSEMGTPDLPPVP